MEKIVSLCKRRGFIFQSQRNLRRHQRLLGLRPARRGAEAQPARRLVEGHDARARGRASASTPRIIMHPAIWKASGHVDTFADLMRECSLTNKRVRADHVEPQSGTVMQFSGAESPTGWKLDRALTVLMKKGEHIESFRKRVRQLIAQNAGDAAGKPEEIVLLGEEKIDVVERHASTSIPRPAALLERGAPVQPDASRPTSAPRRRRPTSPISAPRRRRRSSRSSRTCSTPRGRRCRSASARSARRSATRSRRATSPSARASSSRWNSSSSSSPTKPSRSSAASVAPVERRRRPQRRRSPTGAGRCGTATGSSSARRSTTASASARTCSTTTGRRRRNSRTTPAPAWTSCSSSPSAPRNSKASPRAATSISAQHQKHSGKPQEVFDEELKAAAAKLTDEQKEALIQKRLAAEAGEDRRARRCPRPKCARGSTASSRASTCRTSSSRPPASTAWRSPSSPTPSPKSRKTDEKGKMETLTVLRFHPRIAPIKVGVFPLLKNKPELVAKAREVYDLLKPHMNCFYDETASHRPPLRAAGRGRHAVRRDDRFRHARRERPGAAGHRDACASATQKQERIAIKDLLAHLWRLDRLTSGSAVRVRQNSEPARRQDAFARGAPARVPSFLALRHPISGPCPA